MENTPDLEFEKELEAIATKYIKDAGYKSSMPIVRLTIRSLRKFIYAEKPE